MTEKRLFRNKRSDLYREAVAALERLIAAEGIDAGVCAAAESTNGPILKIREENHVRDNSQLDVVRLHEQRARNCPDRIPGADHTSMWKERGSRKPTVITTQPYALLWNDLQALVAFCQQHKLHADIDGTSWHFPGRTLRIDIRKARGV